MIQFNQHIFQMSWFKHHLAVGYNDCFFFNKGLEILTPPDWSGSILEQQNAGIFTFFGGSSLGRSRFVFSVAMSILRDTMGSGETQGFG